MPARHLPSIGLAVLLFAVPTTVGAGVKQRATPLTRKPITTIRGVTTPGMVVALLDEFRTLTVKRAGSDGRYEFTGVRLREGINRLRLRFLGSTGLLREIVREIRCDTTPPVLSLATPAPAAVVNSAAPLVGGVSEPNVTMIVSADDGRTTQRVTTTTGAFQLRAPPLAEGKHELVIHAVDRAGNETVDRRTLTVDTTPPAVKIVSPDTGTLTRRSRFGVRQGRAHPVSINVVLEAEPDSTVTLLVNNQARGSVRVGPSGKVHFVNVNLPLTQVWLGARAVDRAGNIGRAPQVWLGRPQF